MHNKIVCTPLMLVLFISLIYNWCCKRLYICISRVDNVKKIQCLCQMVCIQEHNKKKLLNEIYFLSE